MAEEMNQKLNSSENRKNKIIQNVAKILCVIIAFGLWIYVMMVESPEYEETFRNIPVNLIKTEALDQYDLAVYSGYGTVIDVKLAGKKSILSKVTPSDIVVTADVSKTEMTADSHAIKASINVPSGCKIIGGDSVYITVYFDESSQKTVSLSERRNNTNLSDGAFVGTIEWPFEKVTVTGAGTVLNRIEKAVVDIDMSGISRTTTITQTITLLDANDNVIESPYLDYYPKEVTLTIPINKTVTVPLDAYFKYGFLGYDNTEVIISPGSVDITGDADIINKGNLVESLEIDEKLDFSGNRCDKSVQLRFVDNVSVSTTSAQVTAIIDNSIRTRKITVFEENIRDVGANPGVKYSYSKDPVTVTLMGSMDALAALSASDINIVLDLSPYFGNNKGTVMVTGTIEINSDFSGQIIEVGSYNIPVTFTEPGS